MVAPVLLLLLLVLGDVAAAWRLHRRRATAQKQHTQRQAQ
jgi:hypothetical protein